jgi:hypothetical protein
MAKQYKYLNPKKEKEHFWRSYGIYVGFEVFKAVTMKGSSVEPPTCFGETCYLHLLGKTYAQQAMGKKQTASLLLV